MENYNDGSPKYQHDCDRCVFLGNYYWGCGKGEWLDYDLYICVRPHWISYLARYGDEGPEYMIGILPLLFDSDHPFRLVYEKAVERGLIPKVVVP